MTINTTKPQRRPHTRRAATLHCTPLHNYFFIKLSPAERESFAARCETTRTYLTQVCYGFKKNLGPKTAALIELESGGEVPMEALPTDFPIDRLLKARKHRSRPPRTGMP